MIRALSTRRSTRGYERLADESTVGLLEGKLKRAPSLPAKVFPSSGKFTVEFTIFENPPPKKTMMMKSSTVKKEAAAYNQPSPLAKNNPKKVKKVHPLFSLFDSKKKSKTTSKPEFARYLEYMREGGIWDSKSNMPVIHYN